MNNDVIIQNLAYLVASVLFIFGLKGLTHPRTAVRGNLIGSLGMLLAVVATLWFTDILSFTWIIVGLIVGAIVGAFLAIKVPMTGMPQMVALLNGFGGAASALVAGGELLARVKGLGDSGASIHTQVMVAVAASGLIGAVTFWGSLVAFAKLQEISFTFRGKKIWMSDSMLLPARNLINALVFIVTVGLAVLLVQDADSSGYYWLLLIAASVLGILITIPIGGADMPVVIALLNSYSGLAACATGFVINNTVLIIAGSLVGASGLILTAIMCKAMNRSLANVMFATLGPAADGPSADDVYAGKVKSTSADEVAMLFDGVQRVVMVPGYGLAVAQAQHILCELGELLEQRGVTVEYAVHPVAGRMPGHMNVLLAEADVPYEKLIEMDQINPQFPQVDVVLIVGANDVVNPDARKPTGPIAGMPILDVDKAKTCVVIKRSLSPGFAGIPNPLFALDNTLMYFGDGKKAITDLVTAVKEG